MLNRESNATANALAATSADDSDNECLCRDRRLALPPREEAEFAVMSTARANADQTVAQIEEVKAEMKELNTAQERVYEALGEELSSGDFMDYRLNRRCHRYAMCAGVQHHTGHAHLTKKEHCT